MVEIVYKYTVKQPGVRYIALNVVSYDLASRVHKISMFKQQSTLNTIKR
jgi:hypothetical protein